MTRRGRGRAVAVVCGLLVVAACSDAGSDDARAPALGTRATEVATTGDPEVDALLRAASVPPPPDSTVDRAEVARPTVEGTSADVSFRLPRDGRDQLTDYVAALHEAGYTTTEIEDDFVDVAKLGFSVHLAYLPTDSGAQLGFPSLGIVVLRAPLERVESDALPGELPDEVPRLRDAPVRSATVATIDEDGRTVVEIVYRPVADARTRYDELVRSLGDAGFTVESNGGQRGLDVATANRGPLDLRITLVTAPGVEPSITLDAVIPGPGQVG